MIFLNPGPFFQEAIESVKAQTFTDWELLLIDDGSSDGSTETALQTSRQAPGQVRYLSHPERRNCGTGASRALGVCQAASPFLAFLDSDDVWSPDYLTVQLDQLQRHPEAAAVCCGTRTWYSWTSSPESDALRPDTDRKFGPFSDVVVLPGELPPLWLRDQAETPGTCSTLVRTEAAFRHGFEDGFRGLFEDQVFAYKLALNESIYLNSATLAYYRQHPRSTCHVAEETGQYDPRGPNGSELRFLLWLRKYLSSLPQEHPETKQALEQRFAAYGPLLGFHCRSLWRRFRRHPAVRSVLKLRRSA